MIKLPPDDPSEDVLQVEKRHAARELLTEAWEEGARAGIEPELLAEEMVQAVVAVLAAERGDVVAAGLAERIAREAEIGILLRPAILQ